MKSIASRILKAGIRASRKFMRSNSPDFMIIGARKAGTSSLHYYLNQHPDLCGSRPKELNYFNLYAYFGRTIAEYESHFRSFRHKKHYESTPAYLYHSGAVDLIKKTYPNIMFITILRDPVDRAYSAWNHYKEMFENNQLERVLNIETRLPGSLMYEKFYQNRKEFPSFRECIDIELEMIKNNDGFQPALLRRGLYLEQLQRYWDAFGRERILVLGFSDLVGDTSATLKKVTDFLGVRDLGWNFLDSKPVNARPYSSSMSGEDRALLEGFYREPNKKLFDEIGKINW